jgi:imidazoleglycerol-phosphate dehydratase/histidinol-phosphatase
MQRILFIDRDGTLIEEPQPDQQVDSLEKLVFLPYVITQLARIARELDYLLVMVTNQDGLGTAVFQEFTFWPAHEKMMQVFENEGVIFEAVHIDRSYPHEQLPTRKPGIGMLGAYLDGDYDLANSYVIGDRLTDVQLAKNLGCRAIFLQNVLGKQSAEVQGSTMPEESRTQYDPTPYADTIDLIAQDWREIYGYLKLPPRKVQHRRSTKETDIVVDLNLDGAGNSVISTGIGFFDHMLDQVARHGNMDLNITAKGDLHIDEHHTVEDTAITLGEAFAAALADKRGMERYGFEMLLPMDDALAQVAVDFGGRPWLVWEADFQREKIGELPTELFFHFFKSFSDAARCNLNIKAEGQNEHHKIEAIFKAFARALKMALRRDADRLVLPSTKGVL